MRARRGAQRHACLVSGVWCVVCCVARALLSHCAPSLRARACDGRLARADRFGNLHLDANDGPAPKRVYEVRQAIRPRSAARSPRPLKKGHYTDYMLHNLADTYFLALRNRDFVEYPAPGQYDVTEASAHGSIPLRFGPPRLDDGKRCRMGRSCDLNASAPRQQDRLRATREHGPLFCKETARRARRSRSAMGSRASWNANSPLNSFMVDRTEDERYVDPPVLRGPPPVVHG
jgi:hypothetical protein